ncbi:MAG: DUF2334 domain-containing protein, partial [Polyangiaceae bacterium]
SDEVEAALECCDAAGIRPALLTVPNFHGRALLSGDARFCDRLRGLQARGHEIYLHGFFHQSRDRYDPALRSGRLAWLFAQRIASGGEAEMSDVSEADGRRLIQDGERVLHEAGLRIDGFVAPAWSMPAWLLPALAERGYRFTEDHMRVYDPLAGRARSSVVLNWATRSPGRLLSTVGWCRAAKYARALMPARVAIHPCDMRYRIVRREIEAMLRWAQGDVVSRGVDLFE